MSLNLDLQIAVASPNLPDPAEIQRWAEAALFATHHGDTGAVIRIVDTAESAALNETYRHKQGPTNVLSFSFETPPGIDIDHLGDIVICAPVVLHEATVQEKTTQAHWAHMVVHGMLHLLGYDHQENGSAAAMEALEIDILAQLGYPDPYGDSR